MLGTIHIQTIHSSNPITYLLRPQCNSNTIRVDSYDYFSWRDCALQLITSFNVKMSTFSIRVWSSGGSQAAKQNLRWSGRQSLQGDHYLLILNSSVADLVSI